MKLSLIAAVVCLLPLVHLQPIDNTNIDTLQIQKQETLETVHSNSEASNLDSTTRDKRTIGPLRQIFPNLSQLVDRKIQMITRVLFRVIGRLVLRGGLGGGGAGAGNAAGGANGTSAAGGGTGRRISITLPTYPPGEDDDDEDEDEDDDNAQSETETTTEGDSKNQLDGAESQVNEVRVRFNRDTDVEEDQVAAASEDDEQTADAAQDVAVAEDEEAVDENRDKRFLNFNLGGGASGGAAGGSGGGSGNFLFDIIRLVAGSGNTEASDERANSAVGVASAEQTVEKDDGYQAGVPGPITRLFIIANRGISNLMQDLILRLAQTSERIVNFKARLITSII